MGCKRCSYSGLLWNLIETCALAQTLGLCFFLCEIVLQIYSQPFVASVEKSFMHVSQFSWVKILKILSEVIFFC